MASIFGDLMQINTTGASESTAHQDNLSVKGVEASNRLAQTDLRRMGQYKRIITDVAAANKIDPAVIAGIISRESRAGATLQDGWGDHGNAFGLMQVDKRYHTPKGAWDSKEHISQATSILTGFIKEIQHKFPTWPKERQYKGGIAAYNCGPNNVKSYEEMDIKTTANDYSNDVVARAQWFKEHHY